MKQCKKLTRSQKELVSKRNLNPKNWGLFKETGVTITIRNKMTGNFKVISKI